MNKLLSTLYALTLACATGLALAQTPAAAPAAGPSAAPVKPQPSQTGPKSLEAKVAMCIGCHGIKGYQASFPEVYRVPMISGQNAKYIAAALNAYKNGDRKHATMRSIAESLTEQDIADISSYYAQHGAAGVKVVENTAPPADPRIDALLKKAACASCHGDNLSKPIDPSYPKIGGQHADYLFVALKAYKTENNPVVGRNNGVMGAIVKQFSNDELKLLARYAASLEGDLKTIPEPRFR